MRIDIGARTDLGCVREGNEDCFRVVPELNLFVVCDGIGGQSHGEVASAMAVDAIVAHCQEAAKNSSAPADDGARADLSPRTNQLAAAIRRANRLIHDSAAGDENLRGMGTTVVGAWLDGERLSLAHVGDSRAYRLRADSLEQLTRDHSLVAEQVRLGLMTEEQAQTSDLQTILIRALGGTPDVEVDVDEHLLLDGDFIMLCSDGLSRMVPDSVIAQTIRASASAQSAADRLIELAREAGGHDNITVVLFRLAPRPQGLLDRLLPWRNR